MNAKRFFNGVGPGARASVTLSRVRESRLRLQPQFHSDGAVADGAAASLGVVPAPSLALPGAHGSIFYTRECAYSACLIGAGLTGNGAAGLRMQIKISPLHRIRTSLAEIVRSGMLAAIKKLVRTRFPDVPHLTTSQLADWLADTQRPPPLLLDVRTDEEFAVSHLPNAQQTDPDSNADDLLAKLPNDRPWVLYCSAGYRSSHLAQRLLQAGATEISNLDGSIFCWVREGRELHSNGPAAQVHPAQVHPYSKIAAKLLRPEHRAPLPC